MAVVNALGAAPDAAQFPHAARWYKHITSFCAKRQASWPVGQVTVPDAPKAAAAAPVKAASPKKPAAKDDDDDDLFASDEEEPELDEFRKKAKEAAMARAAKKEAAAKSQIVFDIKGWGEETDLEDVAVRIKAMKIENLNWGEGHQV